MIDIVFFVCLTIFFLFKLFNSFGVKDDKSKQVIEKTLKEFRKRENIKTVEITKEMCDNLKISVEVSDKEREALGRVFFKEDDFLLGVENAVDTVSFLFGKRDFEKLKHILSETLYEQFKEQVDELDKKGNILKNELICVDSKKLHSVKLNDNIINISVDVETQQVNYVESTDKNVIYGNKKDRMIVRERWIFEREVIAQKKEETFWVVKNIVVL
jgi:hypothetical protein